METTWKAVAVTAALSFSTVLGLGYLFLWSVSG